jgi:hypothetical protein
MKAEEIFGIIVRAIGIWELATSVAGVALIFSGVGGFVTVLAQGAVGGMLLLNADPIVQAAYRGLSRES